MMTVHPVSTSPEPAASLLIHLEISLSYLDAINRETEIFGIIRKGETLPQEVMREYQNIYIIIQELLLNHSKKWVIDKLSNIL